MQKVSREFIGFNCSGYDYIVSNMGGIGYALRNERGNIIRDNERAVVSVRYVNDNIFQVRCLVTNKAFFSSNLEEVDERALTYLLAILDIELTVIKQQK